MDTDTALVAGILFLLPACLGIGFQVGLALGAPWGAYAMGGRIIGSFPPPMRIAAALQAGVIVLLTAIVLAAADVIALPILGGARWTIWIAVAFSGMSLVLNALSRSAGERRLWVPVALGMLSTSLTVALGAG